MAKTSTPIAAAMPIRVPIDVAEIFTSPTEFIFPIAKESPTKTPPRTVIAPTAHHISPTGI